MKYWKASLGGTCLHDLNPSPWTSMLTLLILLVPVYPCVERLGRGPVQALQGQLVQYSGDVIEPHFGVIKPY